jgi:hypothetical protein
MRVCISVSSCVAPSWHPRLEVHPLLGSYSDLSLSIYLELEFRAQQLHHIKGLPL